ncbi:Gfo/Idh/MocA family protein [Portibacter lacus]|uniref:Dehydrogenase n=1 Tax=Portibacter lacus TaxID=1099794 RepID=A0AA37SLM2_9BACT|nr:Gfo/Idh/MocA family oxidoreductase [Portibacter lacus]GLR15562.1 dehydrogenase [Portibacter lacus]
MKKKSSRRTFIKQSSLSVGGIMIVPRDILGGVGFTAANDRINLAAVGAGGKGHSDIRDAAGFNSLTNSSKENVVALCDVSSKEAKRSFEMFPKAARYQDYREMFAEMGDKIDAVTISTPDHMHAPPAMMAMKAGKHVYVQKPLTHDVYEARMLTEAANKYDIVSQMGNQGSSGDGVRIITEWIEADAIGEVKEVHCWTNRPVWEQGMKRPEGSISVPDYLNWDLWLGTAPKRPYHNGYQPFNWRGWWDFGTGALGDMACHVMDPAVRALKLKYPSAVQAFAPFKVVNWSRVDSLDSPPPASMVYYEFPERDGLPPVKLTWYDGGMMPPRPEELADDEPMGNNDGGVLFVGSKGKLMCDCYGANPRLLPKSRDEQFEAPTPTITRVKEKNHQRNWIAAIRGEAEASSDFDYAGPFSEIVLMGNLAIRSLYTQEEVSNNGKKHMAYTGVGRKLRWDGENMKILNYDPANQFVKREYHGGHTL